LNAITSHGSSFFLISSLLGLEHHQELPSKHMKTGMHTCIFSSTRQQLKELHKPIPGVARHVGFTERKSAEQIISGEIVGWVVALPSALIHMVRARPSQNHGEEIHMGPVQTNLTRLGGIIVFRPAHYSEYTRRVSMPKVRPPDTLNGILVGIVKMVSEYSETQEIRMWEVRNGSDMRRANGGGACLVHMHFLLVRFAGPRSVVIG
jgi:hypothetical protein